MNDLRKAARQALEAMERSNNRYGFRTDYMASAITTLRAALAETVPSDCPPDSHQPVQEPQRKPLTDEEIDRITRERWGSKLLGAGMQVHREIARAIERAHGIT